MKITILNGSPKGDNSVTIQSVEYLQKKFPQHDLNVVHISQRIKGIERDETAFREIIAEVEASAGVLWTFPLYLLLVPAQYKRFIELIFERGAQDAFAGKYTAAISTSIHFYDHIAHRYVQGICDDLDMKFTGSFSADMLDLLNEQERERLVQFGTHFFDAIENQRATSKRFVPLKERGFEYAPGEGPREIDAGDKKVMILTDARAHQTNLLRMVDRFQATFATEVEVINLNDLDIKSGCLGCLQCGYANECVFEGQDDFCDFYNEQVLTADILIFAGAMTDRYLSSRWKTYFDRSFFFGHRPILIGKQIGFIISGPLGQNANLRELLEGYGQWQKANVVGFVSDEFGSSAEIDGRLQNLATRAVRFAESGYIEPATFLGVGGWKVFRDDIWGRLRTAFQADHRSYKELGIYDFPQRDLRTRLMTWFMAPLIKIPAVRKQVQKMFKKGVSQRHQRVVAKA
jgi:multimeric flavodoxin WrbA